MANMRINNIIALMVVSVSALMISCNDFLEVNPSSAYMTEENIKDIKDVNLIVTGTYSSLSDLGLYGEMIYMLNDNRSDNGYVEQNDFFANMYRLEIQDFKESKLNQGLNTTWIQHWRAVGRANFVLKISKKFDPTVKGNEVLTTYIGEAQFLRALYYFNLVRIFGEIPVVKNLGTSLDDAKNHKSVSLKEVYEFIIEDLDDAFDMLPEVELQVGRANKACVLALMGKVYLTMAGYPYNDNSRNPGGLAASECYRMAKEKLDILTTTEPYQSSYRLQSNYNDLFDPLKKNTNRLNKTNKEDLFSIQYKSSTGIGLGSPYAKAFGVRDYSHQIPNSDSGGCLPKKDLMDCFTYTEIYDPINEITLADPNMPRDARGMAVAATVPNSAYGLGNTIMGCVRGYGGNGWYMSGKYLTVTSTSTTNSDGDHNWYVLRMADVILMQAEIAYEQSNYQATIDKLNLIVDRANATLPAGHKGIMKYSLTPGDGSGVAPGDFVVLSTTDTWAARKMIQDERRRELALEGHRWFDMVRTNRYHNEALNINHAVDIMNGVFRTMYDNYNNGSANAWEIKPSLIQIVEKQLIYAIPPAQIDLNPYLVR